MPEQHPDRRGATAVLFAQRPAPSRAWLNNPATSRHAPGAPGPVRDQVCRRRGRHGRGLRSATRALTASSQSRSCPRMPRKMCNFASVSSRKRERFPSLITRTSARFTTSAPSRTSRSSSCNISRARRLRIVWLEVRSASTRRWDTVCRSPTRSTTRIGAGSFIVM